MLTAYDSATPADIPENAEAIFPYADGQYAWDHTLRPKARYRYVTVTGDPRFDICDYEPGAVYGEHRLMDWAESRHKAGLDLTVYCDRDNYPAVADALKGYRWHLWLATLDGSQPKRYRGKPLRAVQYAMHGDRFDKSLVYDEGWLINPAA
jgi:hypothetical protein